jgi:SAM-dependent methyltransferase
VEEGSLEFFRLVDEDRYQRYAPWLVSTARFKRFANQDVLEVGCGLGTDLAQFALVGARVTGIDLVPRHLALTRQRFRIAGLDVRLARADAEALPFAAESFDAVYSFGVLHHTPDMNAALSEIHRVLRPGGRIIVGVYYRFAYNLLTFLVRETLRGHLWREPFRVTLGRMEGDGPTTFIHLTTRSELRDMFRRFSDVTVDGHHIQRWPFAVMHDWAERHLGWYLWAEAVR